MSEPDWTLWGRQLQRLIDDVAAIKDEQMVQGALLRGMQGQLNGIASKLDRLDNRVRRLEDREPSHG